MHAEPGLETRQASRIDCATRIIVVGSLGSGKTRLAVALGKLRQLPVIHGDRVFWRPGWTDPDTDLFRADVARLTEADAWIYDGNPGRIADIVLPRAQALIWIEQPVYLSAFRAYARALKYLGRTRPDMGEGCVERLSLSLWSYAHNFEAQMRRRIDGWIREYSPQIPAVVLKGDRQVATFLDGCRPTGSAGVPPARRPPADRR